MNTQSKVAMSHVRNSPKTTVAWAWNASTAATKPMMVRLETMKTGLWMSRPRNWMLS